MSRDVPPHPFLTSKPIGQGTGLRLSMVHEFARQLRGGIYSELDRRTTVCIYPLRPYESLTFHNRIRRRVFSIGSSVT